MVYRDDSLTALIEQLTARLPQLSLLKILSADSDREFDIVLE